jgi:uncharacterized membrane protein
MLDDYQFGYGWIVLLISVACGLASSVWYMKHMRFLEAFMILAAYFFPPYVFFAAKSPLFSLLQQLFAGVDEKLLDFSATIILSPLIAFWAFWLLFGGYALVSEGVDLTAYLIPRSICF